MEGLLNLLPLYSQEEQHDLKLADFLDSCQSHLHFASQDSNQNVAELSHTIGVINAKLNISHTRFA